MAWIGESDEDKKKRERLEDEKRRDASWEKGRKNREQLSGSNLSYSRDQDRENLRKMMGFEDAFKKTIFELAASKAPKEMTVKEINDFKEARDAFVAGRSFQYPSSTVRRTFQGDIAYASQFRGDGDNLLYKIKSVIPKDRPGQFSGERHFSDGTVIKATSIVGVLGAPSLDSINIDVSKTSVLETGGRCSITLINVPAVIQPGMHPNHIHAYGDDAEEGFSLGPAGRWGPNEIEGVNYFKTYYSFENTCSVCDPLDWSLGDQGDFVFQVGNSVGPNPFIYTAPPEPYYGGLDYSPELEAMGFKDIPPDPHNHCVWSFSGCNGEIISSGRDAGGDFILWKAYTEWSSANLHSVRFSRTGLGYMKLKAFVKTPAGKELCSAETIVRVDCCHKESSERIVNLYWEFLSGWPWNCMNQPWFFYGSAQWCEVPDKMNFWYMARIATWYGFNITPLPELKGSCLPFTWTLSGPGIIHPWDVGDQWCEWKLPKDFSYAHPKKADACVDVVITGKDRCGNEKKIVGSCCKYGGCHEIEIFYTSILMGLSQSQELRASCGCPPFTWSSTSGRIEGESDGNTIYFTADSSNVDCAHNPLITVTDCCGVTATLQLYVTDFTYLGTAMQYATYMIGLCPADNSSVCGNNCYDTQMCLTRRLLNKQWNCGSEVIADCISGAFVWTCWDSCSSGDAMYGCWSNECGGHSPSAACGTLYDERDATARASGCCPINPFTGLPMNGNYIP